MGAGAAAANLEPDPHERTAPWRRRTLKPPLPQPAGGKETIATRVAARLRESILRGEVAPGAKLNLDRLREAYRVSLSPLREAVARLAAEGLVEVEDQRGYRVAPISRADLAEIARLRADLESLALSHAIATGDLAWEGEVMGALHRLNRTPRDAASPESLEAWEAAHDAFHLALIRGRGMPLLLRFCATLRMRNDRYRRRFLAANPPERDIAAEHAAIAEAAVAREAEWAPVLLRRHIERAGANIPAAMAAGLAGLDVSPIVFLIGVNLLLLLLGCLLDATTIILVILPLFMPACRELGIDLVHFGVVAVVNCMIGLITPPCGIPLFVITAVTGIPLREIIRNVPPFLFALLIALALLIVFPGISLWLPRQFGYLG